MYVRVKNSPFDPSVFFMNIKKIIFLHILWVQQWQVGDVAWIFSMQYARMHLQDHEIFEIWEEKWHGFSVSSASEKIQAFNNKEKHWMHSAKLWFIYLNTKTDFAPRFNFGEASISVYSIL